MLDALLLVDMMFASLVCVSSLDNDRFFMIGFKLSDDKKAEVGHYNNQV